MEPITAKITHFLTEIGIAVRPANLTGPCILPGIRIENGVILFDESQLLYPGDLLHEAGHLAVMTTEERQQSGSDTGDNGGFEIAAIAWSYAAALHLAIDPAIVFHANGYKGGGEFIVENFSGEHYIGVPVLQWIGMTLEPKNAKLQGVAPYPHMLRWKRA